MCIIVSIVLLLAVSAMSSASDTVGCWNRNTTKIRYSYFANGDRYLGNTDDNDLCMHGYGTYTWASGNVYEGEYQYCLKHGKGKYTWANGDFYVGEFKYDKYHGYGKYTWANGNFYEGELEDNKMHGKGKYIWANGIVLTGEWKNGRIRMTEVSIDFSPLLGVEWRGLFIKIGE